MYIAAGEEVMDRKAYCVTMAVTMNRKFMMLEMIIKITHMRWWEIQVIFWLPKSTYFISRFMPVHFQVETFYLFSLVTFTLAKSVFKQEVWRWSNVAKSSKLPLLILIRFNIFWYLLLSWIIKFGFLTLDQVFANDCRVVFHGP